MLLDCSYHDTLRFSFMLFYAAQPFPSFATPLRFTLTRQRSFLMLPYPSPVPYTSLSYGWTLLRYLYPVYQLLSDDPMYC